MSESPASDRRIAVRFAAVVAAIAAAPATAAEQRGEVRRLVKACQKQGAELSAADGQLLDAGAPVVAEDAAVQDALALVAARLQAYGVERLVLSAQASEADVFDLVKLLATPPDQPDPLAFFAARAAAVDARAIPRTLRAREVAVPEASASITEAPSVKPPAPPPRTSAPNRAVPDESPEPRASGSHETVPDPVAAAPVADPRSELLTESLPVPATADADLSALFVTLRATEAVEALREPLERLVGLADMAFRTGKFDRLREAVAGLVAIEYEQLAKDPSDERRHTFAFALRRLASPVILRQFAVLRRLRAADAVATQQLQAILFRFGTDGAEALADEWATSPTPDARAQCLEALRGLRRTHDALFDLVRHTDDLRVRQAVELLAELGDARAEQLVLEQVRHPEPRTRRTVMAALERFPSASALDALALGLIDEDAGVRLRAVAAMQQRGPQAVRSLAALLETEPDREVLYAAIAALGAIGGADAVQALIRAANGETEHPRRKGASYRLQACAALARIRTPQAMAAVQVLRDDRDREVREGAMRLVAQAARRGTTAMRAVSAP